MKIQDLMDMRKVAELVGDGYLRERAHPEHPTLRIVGYTEKAQWDRLWCHETLTCRGLVYEAGSGEVLARPWPKFFNWGEGSEPLALSDTVQVSDKMDGSLGIIYRNPFTGEWQVATRGSFDSDQARLANAELLPGLLEGGWEPADGWTYLTEIIYPGNRIVLDYGEERGLHLLGVVSIETGETRGPSADLRWPGPVARQFGSMQVGDALAMPPRENAEGLVLTHRDGTMVKVKQEDYVRLHKLVTGLSDKAVWEHLSEGKPLEEMAAAIPDEFHEWLDRTAAGFAGAYEGVRDASDAEYQRVIGELEREGVDIEDPGYRKAFALKATESERPHLLFARLTGKPLAPMIWKELRPVGVRYMNQAAREEALA